MSLQRRLTIFTVTLVTLLSGLLGGFLIKQDSDGAINQIRTELTFIKDSVADSKEDKVTTAVALARSAPFQISVSLVDENGDVTPILEPDEEPQNTIELLVEIEGGSQLKLSASTSGELERRNSSIGNLLIFLISIAALSIIILRLVISRDVERERRAIELAEHLKSENEKRLALLEFAGDASHELRTPLTVIKGYLELGAKSKDIISSPETISKLQREVQRMESTIGSLLEVFEIDAIPSEELEPKNISPLLTDAIKTFSEINPNRVVNSEIEEDLFIKSNDSLIHAVLGNALNNISRHTPHDAPVRLQARRKGSEVSIVIEDGGPGIQNKDGLESIQLFTRFDKSRSREHGGSGLGLSIINSAINKMGGELTLDKSSLGGLALNMKLPASNQ